MLTANVFEIEGPTFEKLYTRGTPMKMIFAENNQAKVKYCQSHKTIGKSIWPNVVKVWENLINDRGESVCPERHFCEMILFSAQFKTCLWQFFSIYQRLSTISSPNLTWSSIHLLFSSLLKIKRKHAGNSSFDSKGSWWWCKSNVEVPFKSWLISIFQVSVQRVWRRIQPTQWRSQSNWIPSWWLNLLFSFGKGGVNDLRVSLV